ncbi:MAG: VOC family protein [Candidatus Heimdallarchaeota archaeon]|nr:VOC family protein [Candidatus Heimdallarchaeota archaeon]
MKIGKLRQIILYVEDMQKQVDFYRTKIGLKIQYPIQDDYSEEAWVAFDTGECTFALHSGGKGRIGEDSPKFTFEVQNVEESVAELREKGVKLGEIREAYPGSFVVHGYDEEGFTFFIQSYPS